MAGLVALCGLFAAFPPAPRLSAQGATPDAALLTELRRTGRSHGRQRPCDVDDLRVNIADEH